MRKLLTFIAALSITGSMLAGGLVTNTNQSAAWVRLPSRNASVGIDAVYFNPAGLMKLENGFHISLSNQSIFQKREIENTYAGPLNADVAPVTGVHYGINQHVYKGTVTAPLFPSVYAAYKLDKIAFSLGFNPIGGGGGAEYKTGLPSFEVSPSDLVPSLAKAGVQGYKLDAYFKGSSTFLGFQGGISYKVNDWLSVAAGLRYVTAANTYEGHLNDIQLMMGGAWLPVKTAMDGIAANLISITGIPTKLAAAPGTFTLAQLVTAGAMTTTDKASIEAGLAAIGVPAANIPLMNVTTIKATVTGATPALNAQAASITATASSKTLTNQSADVAQDGSGFAPIFSVNISPSENLNIALKYEGLTKLELKNKTVQDLTIGYTATGTEITMFPNNALTRNDMPAMLALGVDYKVSTDLKVSFGSNYYFDKSADYGHKIDADMISSTPTTPIANSEIITENGMSIQAGVEYNISEKFLASCGYIWSNKGVNPLYQSDLTYGLGTQTFGFGGAYNVTEKIQINLGAGYTAYKEDSKIVNHMFPSPNINVPAIETYRKSTMMVAIGVDINF